MTKSSSLLFAVLIMAPALACQAATRLMSPVAPSPTDSTTLKPSPTAMTPQPTYAAACPNETSAILKEANTESILSSPFPSVDTGNNIDIPLVTYNVEGDQLGKAMLEKIPAELTRYQSDYSTQQSAWKLFTALIPKEARIMLGQFQIITDGPGGVLSAVEQTSRDPRSWILETDIADIPDSKSFSFTLLHEFGHLLTLGPSQVPPDLQVFKNPDSTRVRQRAVAACPNYFPGEGCSLSKSYMNVFFNRFWRDIYDEWKIIDDVQNDIRRDAKIHSFYRKYRDRFVDSYAATSPSEDIAETWAFYVLSLPSQDAAIKDQKLEFFDEYPELVKLRSRIRDSVCAVNP